MDALNCLLRCAIFSHLTHTQAFFAVDRAQFTLFYCQLIIISFINVRNNLIFSLRVSVILQNTQFIASGKFNAAKTNHLMCMCAVDTPFDLNFNDI